MNRSLLAIATALVAAPALFASAAQACISCEYTPEVVRGSQTSDAPAYRARERVYAVERSAPVKRVIRSESVAKSEPVAKKVDTAEAAPVKTDAKSENSSIASTAEVASAEPVKIDSKPARNENSSISQASAKTSAPEKVAVAEPAAKPTDCKKFFATVGLTLSVPCE